MGYFDRLDLVMVAKQPIQYLEQSGNYDIIVSVKGGGISGQAGAILHGLSHALLKVDESLRPPLRRAGFLTRDSRMVERKKYGRKGARGRFQFSMKKKRKTNKKEKNNRKKSKKKRKKKK